MFRRMIRFFQAAPEYARVHPSVLDDPAIDAGRHRSYQRRIVALGAGFGSLGFLASPAWVVILVREKGLEMEPAAWKALVLPPLMLAVGGTCFGVALGALLAPRDFLEGPVGKRWMGFIGTNSIGLARLVCLLVVLGIIGVMVALPLGLWILSGEGMPPPVQIPQ